jgi:hypothetical protein
MNILDPIFYRTLFYDFRQWTPQGGGTVNIRGLTHRFHETSGNSKWVPVNIWLVPLMDWMSMRLHPSISGFLSKPIGSFVTNRRFSPNIDFNMCEHAMVPRYQKVGIVRAIILIEKAKNLHIYMCVFLWYLNFAKFSKSLIQIEY